MQHRLTFLNKSIFVYMWVVLLFFLYGRTHTLFKTNNFSIFFSDKDYMVKV